TMKPSRIILITAAFLLQQPFAQAVGTDNFSKSATHVWKIDPMHTKASFTIKHMMVSNVRGNFGKVSGTVNYDGKNLTTSSVTASIDANSVNTNEEKRDEHLRSADFFDVEKYPTVAFKSTKVVPETNGFKVYGDLTIHGVTKPV